MPYLQKNLYAWVLDNAVCFENPLAFKPANGPQIFMKVNQGFWKNFKLGNLHEKDKAEKLFLITLGNEETQSILLGDQRFLLRSQKVNQVGRVHLAVKALDFEILGSVEFGAQLEFKSYATFRRWSGFKDCNTSELERNMITKRLHNNQVVYAIELLNPQQATESLRWISPVSRFRFMFKQRWSTLICFTMFYAYRSKSMLLKILCRFVGELFYLLWEPIYIYLVCIYISIGYWFMSRYKYIYIYMYENKYIHAYFCLFQGQEPVPQSAMCGSCGCADCCTESWILNAGFGGVPVLGPTKCMGLNFKHSLCVCHISAKSNGLLQNSWSTWPLRGASYFKGQTHFHTLLIMVCVNIYIYIYTCVYIGAIDLYPMMYTPCIPSTIVGHCFSIFLGVAIYAAYMTTRYNRYSQATLVGFMVFKAEKCPFRSLLGN